MPSGRPVSCPTGSAPPGWISCSTTRERTPSARLYADPPASSDHLLFPLDALVGRQPRRVEVPEAGPDEIPLAGGRLGVVHLLLLIGERTNFQQAFTAVEGSEGDAYLLTRRGTETCLRVSVTGRSLKDLDEVDDALRLWAESVPGAEVTLRGDVVTLGLCTDGGMAPASRHEQSSTLDALIARSELITTTMHAGAGRPGRSRVHRRSGQAGRRHRQARGRGRRPDVVELRRQLRPCRASLRDGVQPHDHDHDGDRDYHPGHGRQRLGRRGAGLTT